VLEALHLVKLDAREQTSLFLPRTEQLNLPKLGLRGQKEKLPSDGLSIGPEVPRRPALAHPRNEHEAKGFIQSPSVLPKTG
jgi:hypothetical protein